MKEADTNSFNKLTSRIKAGGCAAKLGARELTNLLSSIVVNTDPALLAGTSNFEDAAVYKISEDLALVQTLDFFPPMLDDPYLFGQIAAVNALSDIYAMGADPLIALNILCFPTCDYPGEVLESILKGGADKVAEAGAILAGGHSIQIEIPVYGLAVTGLIAPQNIYTNSGAQPDDRLLLTKPLGTGIALLGLKGEQLETEARQSLIGNLTKLNNLEIPYIRKYRVNALTDVTGFGLIGHLHEMSKGSGLEVILDCGSLPLLPQVEDLARTGFVPAGAYGNRESFSAKLTSSFADPIPTYLEDILFDPQTAGGLLIAVHKDDANALLDELKKVSPHTCEIGRLANPAPSVEAGAITLII